MYWVFSLRYTVKWAPPLDALKRYKTSGYMQMLYVNGDILA
jgi:hypothetical protein